MIKHNKIRRINIWGGPGSGKSTVAAWLFAQLKILGHDIQFVEEYVKRWAYQGRRIISFDQLYVTSHQIVKEDELLRNDVSCIITDSPCMIGYFYAERDKLSYAPLLLELGAHVERAYPSINIFLIRDTEYQTRGRYETEEEAKQLDDSMLRFLEGNYRNLIVARSKQLEPMLEKLNEALCRPTRCETA